MSIQSEITRISSNVTNTLDAVSSKGVVVSATATSDDMAQLVASIPSVQMLAYQIYLPTSGWTSGEHYTYTVSVNGVSSDTSVCSVVVSYSPGYKEEYVDIGTEVISQGDGTITLQVDSVPTSSFPINVLVLTK